MKIIALDTETTGLEPGYHEITQIAGAIIVDWRIECWFDFKMRPDFPDRASQEALDGQGRTLEQLVEYPSRLSTHVAMTELWGEYVNRFDKSDKASILGYNVSFDLYHLSAHFKALGDNYLGSFLNWEKLDVLALLDWEINADLPGRKLTQACEYYGIKLIDAHNAISDIDATIRLAMELSRRIKFSDNGAPLHRNYEL